MDCSGSGFQPLPLSTPGDTRTQPWPQRNLNHLPLMKLNLTKSIIRSFRPDNAEAIASHLVNDNVTRNLNAIPQPYTLQRAEEWIQFATGLSPETRLEAAHSLRGPWAAAINYQLPALRHGPFAVLQYQPSTRRQRRRRGNGLRLAMEEPAGAEVLPAAAQPADERTREP